MVIDAHKMKKMIYEDGLKSPPYLPLMTFLNNDIQALQHWWKKYVERNGNYVEKQIWFGHFRLKYLGQLMNFSADTRTRNSFV